jgi:hypothetical protein
MLLSPSPEQSGKQTTLLADRLRLDIDRGQFRVGFCFGYSFSLRFRLDISFSRKLLSHLMLRFFLRSFRWRIGRGAPLHVLLWRREYLNPTWKVVPALVPGEVLETGADAMFLVKNDLVRDLHREEASFWGGDINSTDTPFAKALHRTRRMKVDANSTPNRNVQRSHLRHS